MDCSLEIDLLFGPSFDLLVMGLSTDVFFEPIVKALFLLLALELFLDSYWASFASDNTCCFRCSWFSKSSISREIIDITSYRAWIWIRTELTFAFPAWMIFKSFMISYWTMALFLWRSVPFSLTYMPSFWNDNFLRVSCLIWSALETFWPFRSQISSFKSFWTLSWKSLRNVYWDLIVPAAWFEPFDF